MVVCRLATGRRLFPMRYLSLQWSGYCLTSSEYYSLQTKSSSHIHDDVAGQSQTSTDPLAKGVTTSGFNVIHEMDVPVSRCPSIRVKTVAAALPRHFVSLVFPSNISTALRMRGDPCCEPVLFLFH